MKSVREKFLFLVFTTLLMSISSLAASTPAETKSLYDQPWEWTGELGQKVTFSQFKGSQTVVTLTYTSCKMSCPMTIRQLKKMEGELRNPSIPTQFVIVSIDPRIDTYQKLSRYKKSWKLPEDKWHFYTSTPENIKSLSQFLGFHYEEIDEHFIHDKTIFIFDRDGVLTKKLDSWDSIN